MSIFVHKCFQIFVNLEEKNISFKHGIESIISIAAYELSLKNMPFVIKNAGSYIYRYWTGNDFYLIATNITNNPVVIYHLPNEKQTGMVALYNYYLKYQLFPNKKNLAKLFNIQTDSPIRSWKQLLREARDLIKGNGKFK